MDFQLITGRPDTTDYLAFTTTFTHNNVFYKAALAETISWGGQLTGTYDALLQSGRGTQRLTLVKDGEQEMKLNRSVLFNKTWLICSVKSLATFGSKIVASGSFG